jgi:hypothetical protein
MKLVATLRDAINGWVAILRGQPDWASHFRFSAAGLATAVVLFYLFAFLAIVIGSMAFGVPTPAGLIAAMLGQSLFLVALVVAIFATRSVLRDRAPVLPLLVPGVYALVAYLALGTLMTLVFAPLLPLLWLVMAWLLYRLGRVAARWTLGVASAFGILSVVLLVGIPATLYMLFSPLAAA